MTKENLLELYSSGAVEKGQSSPFWEDFDAAFAKYDDFDKLAQYSMKPCSEVQTSLVYGVEIYQEYGLVNEAEFFRLTGITPKEAGKTPSPFHMLMPQKGENNQQLYLVALQGLPLDEMLAIKKLKIFFTDSCEHSKQYLSARDQLVKDQGQFVFEFAKGEHGARRPKIPQTVASFADIQKGWEQKKILE